MIDENIIIQYLKDNGFIPRKDISINKKIAFSRTIDVGKETQHSLRIYIEVLNKFANNSEIPNLWTETPLKDFGFKCIASKHDLCSDEKCVCLCHKKEVDQQ